MQFGLFGFREQEIVPKVYGNKGGPKGSTMQGTSQFSSFPFIEVLETTALGWYTPVIPTFRRYRQECPDFHRSLGKK